MSSGKPVDRALLQRVRQLWDAGLSTAEIGRQVGRTKNTVCGIAHRNAFPSRPSPIRPGLPDRVVKPWRPVMTAPPPIAPPRPPAPPPAPARVAPARSCQWPIGEPGTPGFRLCGEPRDGGRLPYCAVHHAQAVVRPREGDQSGEHSAS